MSLTASEEALVRQLLDQQAAILSLAGNEATITSKLGATKVTLADLVAASSLADADLLLARQGTTDKSVRADTLATYMASELGVLFAPIANPTFTGDPTAPTATQFDDDTSLATTAFVQRALGNAAGFVGITTSQALTAAQAGQIIYASTTGAAITLTLPAANSLKAGSRYEIYNTGTNDVTVTRAGSDTIVVNNTTNTVTSVTLRAGDSIELINLGSGTLWYHAGGTAQLRHASGQYGASLGTTGWQRLPSGLIVQWGPNTATTSGISVTLPIAFPSLFASVLATAQYGANVNETNTITVAPTGLGSFAAYATRTNTLINAGFYWVAIGY